MRPSKALGRYGWLAAISLVSCGGRTDIGDPLAEPGPGSESGGQIGSGGLPWGTGGSWWGSGGIVALGGTPFGSGGTWSSGGFPTGGAAPTGGAFPTGGLPAGGSAGAPACPDGYYDPPETVEAECRAVSHCAPGWFVYRHPTPWSDRVCAACSGGYSLEEDSAYCRAWTPCTIDQIGVYPGSGTTDATCGDNPQINTLPISDQMPEMVRSEQSLVLLTSYGIAPHLRTYSSPGLAPEHDVLSSINRPYQTAGQLVRGSGTRVYYLDVTQRPGGSAYGYGLTPIATLLDSSSLATTWESTPGWPGAFAGATALSDDTLVAFAYVYEDYLWRPKLARWTVDATASLQSLENIVAQYQGAYLRGSDSEDRIYLTRSYPIELVRLDSTGALLNVTDLSTHFASVHRAAILPSGASFLLGADLTGRALIVSVQPDGVVGSAFYWAANLLPGMMRAHGENVVIGGCTTTATGYRDALVLELTATGDEVRSWQFGGGADDCVITGDVALDGRITVVAEESYSLHLVELLP